jgi:hypothetical protein
MKVFVRMQRYCIVMLEKLIEYFAIKPPIKKNNYELKKIFV